MTSAQDCLFVVWVEAVKPAGRARSWSERALELEPKQELGLRRGLGLEQGRNENRAATRHCSYLVLWSCPLSLVLVFDECSSQL